MKPRVLLASPVKQQERILSEFLESITRLEASQVELDFAFIDDHNGHSRVSSKMARTPPTLRKVSQKHY